MASPFPGMDPFLEDPDIWPDFHYSLAGEIKRVLNRTIGPKYYAAVDIFTVPHDTELEISHKAKPDVGVFEPIDTALELAYPTVATLPTAPIVLPAVMTIQLRAVRVYRTHTGELVTSIEILSPFNKRPASDGLMQYRLKRSQILASRVNLVEIDLLRGGERPALELIDHPVETDYILLVNRFQYDRLSEIWPVALNEALPLIPIPLLPPDPPVPLDLNAIIRDVYATSGYDWRLTYKIDVPPPPLRPTTQEWVNQLLAKRS
jgi:hypothetical protein